MNVGYLKVNSNSSGPNHSFPSSAKVKNAWMYNAILSLVFVVSCIISKGTALTVCRGTRTRRQQFLKKPAKTFRHCIVATSGQPCWKLMVMWMESM